jgi:sugar (pentulose or hexulose) kinase
VTTTHGASAALIDETGLVLPMIDYEFEPPAAFAEAYRKVAPGFDESFAPILPGGINVGRHLYWQQQTFPDAFRRVRHILC